MDSMEPVSRLNGAPAEGEPLAAEKLERIDYFEDLRERYVSFDGLGSRWLPKDPDSLSLDKPAYLRLHHLMSLTRAVEETLDSAFRAGHVPGTAFFGRGNEAASVGGAFCLRDDEWLVPMHRNCGAHLAKGHPPESIMAQFFGRVDSPSAGREGNLHLGYRPKKITQLISHIGTMVPIAAGLALAARSKGPGSAVLTYIGDGGTSTGDFHEGLNFAAVRRLPLVVVIDNNQYAYKTAPSEQYASPTLAQKAPGYGIPGYLIDGTDLRLVLQMCGQALERARAGEGPTLIESVTMRTVGHSVYDKFTDYVDLENLKRWVEQRDPIRLFDKVLLEHGIATEEELRGSHERAREQAESARDTALQSPFPTPESVTEGVYAE